MQPTGSAGPVRWGFIGAGGIAQGALAPAVHAADGAVLQAVAARDPARAALLEPVTVHRAYGDLIGDPDVDAVYLSLHNNVHITWVTAALAGGKHVLCEKPLGLSAGEVSAMADAAAAAGRLLVEAAWNRWHPRTREAERLVAAGAVGEVRRVVSSFSGGPVPAGNYRYQPEFGGGALYDVGCYALAGALWAFGWQQPTGVTAQAEFWPEGADSRTVARLGFPGGGEAVVTGGLDGVDEEVLEITGSAARLELVPPAWMTRDRPVRLRLSPAGGQPTESSWPALDAYRLMVEEVSRAVRGEPAYVVPLEQSSVVAQTIDRIRAAVTPAT